MHAEKHGFTFPVLKDDRNKIADAYGATKTPEVFVLDPKGSLLYHGRIDERRERTPTRSVFGGRFGGRAIVSPSRLRARPESAAGRPPRCRGPGGTGRRREPPDGHAQHPQQAQGHHREKAQACPFPSSFPIFHSRHAFHHVPFSLRCHRVAGSPAQHVEPCSSRAITNGGANLAPP